MAIDYSGFTKAQIAAEQAALAAQAKKVSDNKVLAAKVLAASEAADKAAAGAATGKAADLKKAQALLAQTKQRLAEAEATQKAYQESIASGNAEITTMKQATETEKIRLVEEKKATEAEAARVAAAAEAARVSEAARVAEAARIAALPKLPSGLPAASSTTALTTTTPTPATPVTPLKTDAELAKEIALRNSIEVMRARFKNYNLETLIPKIEQLARDGASEATITLQLQETPEYKARFSANELRIKKGLQVLTPAEYLSTEDSYRQVLRSYGLTQFDNDSYVKQFISNDVSPTELSNRVVMAVQRVQNADPAVISTMKDYYGIGQGDVLAYVLDPEQQLPKIQRQIAAAEIGVAARTQGLETGVAVAEQLAAQGISMGEAQKGYATIADILPTAEKLSAIYGKTVPGYGQAEAEQEVFNSLASAQRKRQKLTATEVAAFSGSAGTTKGTLASQTRGMI